MTDYANGFRLDGKVALVTGAARGIGAEIAIALAAMGAKVLVTDVAEEGGRGTAETIVANGGMASAMRHDVTVEGEWELVIAEAVKRFGGLDVLVNNAGIETAALVSQCTVEAFRRTMDVNVTGVFLGVKHAVLAMSPGGAAGRGGSIINMSSVAGIIGTLAHTAYNTSKGAVRLLTKATAVECAQLGNGIRVNSIHPAIIATKMGRDFVQDYVDLGLVPDLATADSKILALHPMGYGEPRDVAGAALYLASDLARWINGTELVVDGGLVAA